MRDGGRASAIGVMVVVDAAGWAMPLGVAAV